MIIRNHLLTVHSLQLIKVVKTEKRKEKISIRIDSPCLLPGLKRKIGRRRRREFEGQVGRLRLAGKHPDNLLHGGSFARRPLEAKQSNRKAEQCLFPIQ
ncbi:LOW QUALITY PROTEIN: hypothetical protein TorRG33x02_189930 [Trema orientale]|uniref:Uncharacterized protein n=1 Tax=Trema orientale TaxID=63057 RepID=A0A2P5EHZ9_TREOI|nr:LOW QUALITY PROTEIN: hypothetical protein TorRG33x02_189930 [Trema orientale]